ncbi:hypothetical protein Tco_0028633, partial [Tanacetum coccineum]
SWIVSAGNVYFMLLLDFTTVREKVLFEYVSTVQRRILAANVIREKVYTANVD